MKTNMHKLDRTMRLIFALVVGIYFSQNLAEQSTAFRDILFYLAFLFGITGIINFCPLYRAFGIDTSKADDEK